MSVSHVCQVSRPSDGIIKRIGNKSEVSRARRKGQDKKHGQRQLATSNQKAATSIGNIATAAPKQMAQRHP